MYLVETNLAHITSFTVAEIEVADFDSPAIHCPSVAGRLEQNVFVGQIDRLYVGKSQT